MYINDDLTEFRQKLLYDARMLVKRKKLKGAWSQHGNVMVLTDMGKPSAIFNYSDLRVRSGTDPLRDVSSDELDETQDSDLDLYSDMSRSTLSGL